MRQLQTYGVLLLVAACGTTAPAPVTAVHIPEAPIAATPPPPSSPSLAAEAMTLDTIDEVVASLATDVVRSGNVWEFSFQGVPLAIVTDERADRMRIVSPVARIVDLTPDHHRAILAANFHTALDARYATSGGVLYSAFIHPLRSLQVSDLESGIAQTAALVRTFGTTYSSTDLVFGAARP